MFCMEEGHGPFMSCAVPRFASSHRFPLPPPRRSLSSFSPGESPPPPRPPRGGDAKRPLVMTDARPSSVAADGEHPAADARRGPTQTQPPTVPPTAAAAAAATTSAAGTAAPPPRPQRKYRQTCHSRPDLRQECKRCHNTTASGTSFVNRNDDTCIDCTLWCPVCGGSEQRPKGSRGHSVHTWTADSSISGKGRGPDHIPPSLRAESWEGRQSDAICDQCLEEHVCKWCGCSEQQGAVRCLRHHHDRRGAVRLSDGGRCTHCVEDRKVRRAAGPSEREQRERRLRSWQQDVDGATRLVIPTPRVQETERCDWRRLRAATVVLLGHLDTGAVLWGPSALTGLTTYTKFMSKLGEKCHLGNNPYGLLPGECAARMVSALIAHDTTTAGQRRRLKRGVTLVALPW